MAARLPRALQHRRRWESGEDLTSRSARALQPRPQPRNHPRTFGPWPGIYDRSERHCFRTGSTRSKCWRKLSNESDSTRECHYFEWRKSVREHPSDRDSECWPDQIRAGRFPDCCCRYCTWAHAKQPTLRCGCELRGRHEKVPTNLRALASSGQGICGSKRRA